MQFNDAQSQAVCHREGPMMVLAGPGSGKTTVITGRVRFLVEECGVPAGNILVITFTRAAAMEMKERFLRLCGGCHAGVQFGTFHAVFFSILKHAYRFDAGCVVSDRERDVTMRGLIDKEGLEAEDAAELSKSLLMEIGTIKGDMLDIDHYHAKSCGDDAFRAIYTGYEKWLKDSGRIDFDDMLGMCCELLEKRPDILSAWQEKFKYILIDEFQDINAVQYRIIRMLALPENNLFIVGDDDQSIYRFRGARPEIMLGFEKNYPGAGRVLLSVNYRSTKEIIESSLRLIDHNRARYKKALVSGRGTGHAVEVLCYENAIGETLDISSRILKHAKEGGRLSDVAVLYRTSLEPRLLIRRLMEYNIPFSLSDGMPNIFEHWIAEDFIAYMQAAKQQKENPSRRIKRSLLLRIANRPNRYIGRDALSGTELSLEDVENFYQGKAWMEERLAALFYDLKNLAALSPAAAINYIRKAVGYDVYLAEYADKRHIDREELLRMADELKESASEYNTLEEWLEYIKAYGEKLKEKRSETKSDEDSLKLMTMHSSKGLEFKTVFILDANEKITPHRKALLDADIEEERRMFYVAMTRAKDMLYICHVKNRYGRKQEPSRFIGEVMGKGDKTGERRRLWQRKS